ncbi:MAG: hypothetical protein V1256_09460, partial [Candidatus Neomarinimicrobiota bacterium]|nr:hypothetical protein [Candidatus Neomarinimicrobiota bacterium]
RLYLLCIIRLLLRKNVCQQKSNSINPNNYEGNISFLNHFPNLNLVNDGGTVEMKEAPTS